MRLQGGRAQCGWFMGYDSEPAERLPTGRRASGFFSECLWTALCNPARMASIRGYLTVLSNGSSGRDSAMNRPTHTSRRDFLQASAATTGLLALGPRAYARVVGANERIHFGVIGLGVMGSGHL